jgi:hypothetical protein
LSVSAWEADGLKVPIRSAEPVSDHSLEFAIEVCSIGSNPQSTTSLGNVVWVDVHATDHISCRWIEHRVGKGLTAREFLGMLDEIGTVVIQ